MVVINRVMPFIIPPYFKNKNFLKNFLPTIITLTYLNKNSAFPITSSVYRPYVILLSKGEKNGHTLESQQTKLVVLG